MPIMLSCPSWLAIPTQFLATSNLTTVHTNMTLKYLIAGATGGLGQEVLNYFVANVPSTKFAAASSSPANRVRFEQRGIAFRHVNYDDEGSLDSGLKDVENLLFVSTNSFDNEERDRQHRRLISAAKRAGVKHVWYTSLAFGGFSNDSKAAIQKVHLTTERLLRESGLTYTSIREGVYLEAFPVFMNWYPDSKTVSLPADGEIAYTRRAELGEATARLMIKGGHENEIVLLTAEETITAKEVVDVINESTNRQVEFKLVSSEEYVAVNGANDQGGKPTAFFEKVASWWEDIGQGALRTTSPLMCEVLGRKPTGPEEGLREIMSQNPDYIWHQNYA
ncbi:putative NmrA-like family protein [Aspergillus stella-maris]|uniref:putative NmrA-like family protein n=1 Tax=Aspergillus stella-maris TaxID=1810926 RepID=UPI003CCDA8B9